MNERDLLKAFERLFPQWKWGSVLYYGENTIRVFKDNMQFIFEYYSDDNYYLKILPFFEPDYSKKSNKQQKSNEKFIKRAFASILITALILLIGLKACSPTAQGVKEVTAEEESILISEPITEEIEIQDCIVKEVLLESEEETDIYEAEKEMLAQLVEAEAGNQCLTGKRFVVDVVLNRVADPRFPNTIEEVIFQGNPTQFSVTKNGRFESVSDCVSEESRRAVELEWEERLDYGILYFSSTSKPVNGKRAFKYYDHWFSY